MKTLSAASSEFFAKTHDWLTRQAEVLVQVSLRRGGGSTEFFLSDQHETLLRYVRSQPEGAWITVYKEFDLSLRGIVDDAFIERCQRAIPDGCEYLVTERELTIRGRMSWYHYGCGNSHAELRDDLEECWGQQVLAGRFTPAFDASEEVVINAIVPDSDGILRPGPY